MYFSDNKDEFESTRGAIHSCPACKGENVELSPEDEFKSEAAGCIAEALGDDIDGMAATLEDFNLL